MPLHPPSPPQQSDPWTVFTDADRYLREGDPNSATAKWLMGLGAALVVALLALWLWERHKLHRDRPRPIRIFLRTARGAGLAAADLWLLYRIARRRGLPSPLTLLLSPATLGHHAQLYCSGASPRRQARVMGRVAKIQRTLER